ncbi:hypothetical protein BDZ90DRAFT_233120 [Jaminaea rosea]|uniref:Mitochondrial fission process protein 1 n=1 Tax=Jaminaea rosea TaxID=1569628 RepID=A0A316UTS3_9BASI|nr:hypothetical protein BDZ90DRAFT_233120 [Jaminaea rosea]PWN26485.1 hypothetical protein BDZ90DRAFT_233120 [Jaminaea rosea]
MSVPGEPDAVENAMEQGPGRYAVFANRLRTAFVSGLRYSAYSSELGEAFRPMTKPAVVRGLYAISWTWVSGDVAYAGYKAREQHRRMAEEEKDPALKAKRIAEELAEKAKHAVQGSDAGSQTHHEQHHEGGTKISPLELSENGYIALVSTRRAVLQSLVSMALPAVTVHQTVHYSAPLFNKFFTNHRVKAFGPTALGLSLIPFFPLLFDEPGEKFVDGAFDYAEALYFGKAAPSAETAKATAMPLALVGTASMGKGLRRQWASQSMSVATATSTALRAARPNAWMVGGGSMLAAAAAVGASATSSRPASSLETMSSS